MSPQNKRIMSYLKKSPTHSITASEAKQFLGVERLASRINELKTLHKFDKKMICVENRFGEKCRVARYVLI